MTIPETTKRILRPALSMTTRDTEKINQSNTDFSYTLPIVAKHLCQRVLFVAPVTEREKSVNVETTKRTLRQALSMTTRNTENINQSNTDFSCSLPISC